MRVAIVGGGYAGRLAMVRLRRAGMAVTLVDARSDWVERTRLHEAAARGREVRRPHRRLADAVGANFHHGRMTGLDGTCVITDRGEVPADRVLVAVGSEPVRDLAGVREHAWSLGDPAEAGRILAALRALPGARPVVVVGAGLTGLELATEVAGAFPARPLTLVGDPTTGLSRGGAEAVRRRLRHLGITVAPVRALSVVEDGVETTQGFLPSALTLSAAGMRAPPALGVPEIGLPLDAAGRIRVDETLAVVGRPGVYAAGDCCAGPGALAMACATAMPQGAHAARAIADEARGRRPAPFRFRWVLRSISLGRGAGLVQPLTPGGDPSDAWWRLSGRPAAWVKRAILAGAADVAASEVRWGPLFTWRQGPARRAEAT